MGGHGGLNILPQKKWNVYRKDVQYKVNYDENKIIKEEEKKERKKNELAFEKTISHLKNNIHIHYNNEKKGTTTEYNEHINLFMQEEKEINRRNKMHEEYLIKKCHYIYNDENFNGGNCIYDKKNNAKIISDFDKIKISQSEWFLNKENFIFLKKSETNELKNDQTNRQTKCQTVGPFTSSSHDKHSDKFKQKKGSSESKEHEYNDAKTLKHRNDKREKEKTKKYDHIRTLIKYKKDKKKRKRERKRKKEKERERKRKKKGEKIKT
ncbi:hypothetical protein MKS88_002455 [Plasmodium brasilianum]|uniref:CBF1-interacting co-repressor CIR N-terminal domain-containing protein n=2 Tax=Plasmodium (Plasmodium) TaxID=418103 RepID=A0A1A8VYG8_PLAMA|nr:conserved Plasmodium protein, unknown function [Plasmodium malariae]KAI4838944.1 hypothetical protein MKS88_002455 [Plasmodium brasilianum]SBS84755.1 conserved Plasmodium protein, unknown function [Plasmodium malariae]SCN12290.1 conserved Plasmodium protein, unknown function [Plasmodium malariae]